MGFGVWDLGFGIRDLRFGIWGSGTGAMHRVHPGCPTDEVLLSPDPGTPRDSGHDFPSRLPHSTSCSPPQSQPNSPFYGG